MQGVEAWNIAMFSLQHMLTVGAFSAVVVTEFSYNSISPFIFSFLFLKFSGI